MALNVVGGRFIIRKTDKEGKIPTISAYDDHTSGKWIDTDIYEAELYINTNDNKMWFRNNNNQVIEIPTLDINTSKLKDDNLPNMFGKLNYIGVWDLNSDTFPKVKHQKGDYYIINDNGFINGIKYVIGDFIVFDGRYWDKIDNYKKEIYTTDIIYSDDIKLNDILLQLINRTYFEDGIVSKKIKIIDDIEIFNVDIEDIKYKNNSIYHNGNSNNNNTNWNAKTLLSKQLITDDISTNNINVKDILSVNVSTNDISAKNINTNTLLINSGRIEFGNSLSSISVNGKGLEFKYLKRNIFDYKTSDDSITFSKKIKYDSDITFDNDLEIVNKKYVINKINETQNVEINDLFCNEIIIYKDVKYINIDININGNFNLLLDEIEKNNNSSLVVICVDTNNNNDFELSIKSSDKLLFNINSVGINSLYFNIKNKKWYKN